MSDWLLIAEQVGGFSTDPIFLIGLLIVGFALAELRRCFMKGWHRPEGVSPGDV